MPRLCADQSHSKPRIAINNASAVDRREEWLAVNVMGGEPPYKAAEEIFAPDTCPFPLSYKTPLAVPLQLRVSPKRRETDGNQSHGDCKEEE